MITLNDPSWKEFEGGYRFPYDASKPLQKLEATEDETAINEVFIELWEELHHQGDVGLASYYAVPHLIRIAKEKKILNYNIFGLIAVIETERHDNNPKIPVDLEGDYIKAIKEGIPELVSMIIQRNWDITLSSSVMAALAVAKGHIELAKAILKMEDIDVINEFLESY